MYTDFSKVFDRMLHGLYTEVQFVNFIWWFAFVCSMGSHLTGRTHHFKLEDYLSESIQSHSGVPQGSHLGPIIFILDINEALDFFENMTVLTIKCIASCFEGI
jgi:hypothetical protein